MSHRPALRALADRCGIAADYEDILERRRHETRDSTREALLIAMGFDPSSESSCTVALERLDHGRRRRAVPTVEVVAIDSPGRSRIEVRLPARLRDVALTYRTRIAPDPHDTATLGPATRESAREGECRGSTSVHLPVPDVGPGFHRLSIAIAPASHPDEPLEATQRRILVPDACPDPALRFPRPSFGLCANLFSVRGAGSEGIGDLANLAELLGWCADVGGAFLGVGPLLATRNRGPEVSPYSPFTRLFRNPLYLRLAAIPELHHDEDARSLYDVAGLARLDERPRIAWEELDRRKRAILQRLHVTFRRRELAARTPRGLAFQDFVHDGGEPLRDYATFCALEDRFGPRSTWPDSLGAPDAPDVLRFREEYADAVELHQYVQFEIDRQLASAAGASATVALYTDQPVGTTPDGFDCWAFPDVLAPGVTLGAPPDPFNPAGQNWDLAPMSPRGLRHDGYRYWSLALRASLRCAGAIRIDHVTGLMRQFWIPEGRPPSEGAYVGFPHRDLFGILALEADRHGAAVVGEDLGTIPAGLPEELTKWRILSSKVLYFERGPGDELRASASYPADALATVNTHDLPTLQGYFEGTDLRERRAAGQLKADELELARERRQREGEGLWNLLRHEDVASHRQAPEDVPPSRRLRAAHRFLSRTPCRLVGLAVDDLGGETEGVNLPGVPADQYPSWTRRMRLTLEELARDAGAREALDGARSRSTRRGPTETHESNET